MKIFAIIFIVLGVIGVIYCVPNGLYAMNANLPGAEEMAVIQFSIAIISFLVAVLGYLLYKKENYKEELVSTIQNLKPRKKIQVKILI